jgi:hypothetical protein
MDSMTRPRGPIAGAPRRLGAGLAAVALAAALAAGCTAPSRIAVPADLPETTREDTFEMRWALQREGGVVRAVGLARSLAGRETSLTLGLFGVDREGRVASRSSTPVRFRFDIQEPAPFEMTLRPTGTEVRFELHVIEWTFFTGPPGADW